MTLAELLSCVAQISKRIIEHEGEQPEELHAMWKRGLLESPVEIVNGELVISASGSALAYVISPEVNDAA